MRTRFAPSPTGYLHIGHIASAIYVWGYGRRLGAEIILRVEDHDRGRCRPQFEEALQEDLAWLGLRPDNALCLAGKSPSVFRQSDSEAHYLAALDHLSRTQEVYACICSRREIRAQGSLRSDLSDVSSASPASDESELRYPGTCRARKIPWDTPQAALRLALPSQSISFQDLSLGPQTQTPREQCGDLLLRDRHGYWTYQFAVAVDDLRHGITHVIRGIDLLPSTGRQILLGRWLGRREDAHYLHHPVIVDAAGQKLSKRFLAESISQRRTRGAKPEDLLGEAAFLVGLLPAPRPLVVAELESLPFPPLTKDSKL